MGISEKLEKIVIGAGILSAVPGSYGIIEVLSKQSSANPLIALGGLVGSMTSAVLFSIAPTIHEYNENKKLQNY